MDMLELNERLKELNPIEKELKDLSGCKESDEYDKKLKYHFSNKLKNDYWVINNEKLMKESEVISIHKHDRFIKFDKHKHDFLEMMFVYSGCIRQEIEGEKLIVSKGEILLLDMNVGHSIEEAGEDDIAINILIKKEFFDWMFMNQIAYNDLISNFVVHAIYGKKQIKQYIHFKTPENDRVWEFMKQILIEYYEGRSGMETAIRAYMLLLFNELLRDYQKYLSNQMIHKIDSSISSEILNYINANYKDVTLKIIAEHLNYNQDYIGKLIKKITGKNLTELVREKRIKQAEYLLKSTDMAVVDIVTEIGYSNVSYFYKHFKEELGITPDEYRKTIGVSKC
jgi:YesN/AraC family two-component response regulator